MTSLGLGIGLNRIRPAAAAGLDPPDFLFAANQYGDFVRAKDSSPASSGGLLTRWTGQRASGNAGTRFDITPNSNAPTVSAAGAGGESCIVFETTGSGFVGSEDRGGASSISVHANFANDMILTTGKVVIAHVNVTGSGAGAFLGVTSVSAWTAAAMLFEGPALYYTHSSVFNYYGGPITTTQPVGNGPGWLTLALRFKPDGSAHLYANNGSTPVASATGITDDIQMSQWLSYVLSGMIALPMDGFFYGHINPSDADFEHAFNWVAGG